jgi:two-component system, NtrC family, response regulator AtoC
VGRFAAADGGTLFLDEIGDLPLNLQVRLLRVLQDHEITPVGESAAIPIDVRVITATHRNLEDMVTAGAFRQDLFYRLNVVQIEMPALRERREDIGPLAERFLESAAHRVGRKLTMSAPVKAALERHDWPGNVRELENLMERLAIIARESEISLGDLPPKMAGPSVTAPIPALAEEGVDMPKTLASIERQMIEEALRKTGGNKNKAAALLGINRTTLVEKLKRNS